MSMSDWAKREVEIACKMENPDRKEGEWDYGCSCYESALKSYLSLMEDGHSGMSFSFTRMILKRLLEEKPLSPIEDIPENWSDICSRIDDEYETFQCSRMGSLFKDVYSDGHVTYHDIERYYCKNSHGSTFKGGFYSHILDEMYPITMPYYPPLGYFEIIVDEFLTDPKNGDFDTIVIHGIKEPSGNYVVVNRYFKDAKDGFDEIDYKEFIERKRVAENREKENNNESEQA